MGIISQNRQTELTENMRSLRLLNHGIARPSACLPGSLLEKMGPIQGQDALGARWSLGLRLSGYTETRILASIGSKEIVRSWINRGTLHYASGTDFRWIMEFLAPRFFTEEDRDWSGSRESLFFRKYLGQEKTLTREQIKKLLDKEGLLAQGVIDRHFINFAARQRIICFAPDQAKSEAFVLLDDWLPEKDFPVKFQDRESQLGEFTLKYFTARGPASLDDFVWWSGLTKTEAQKGLSLISSGLESAVLENREYFWPKEVWPDPRVLDKVYLLPGFDEFLLSYKDRSLVLDPGRSHDVCPGGNGMFFSTFLIRGKVAGTWRRTVKKNSVEVSLKPFKQLPPKEEKAFWDTAAEYAAFLEMPLKKTES